MAPSDKNFVRNVCLAAGFVFAFLLMAPIKFGPNPPVTPSAANATETVAEPTGTLRVNDTKHEDMALPVAPAEFLDIPLTIGDNRYRFSVLKNKENIPSLAAQVCNENAQALGLATASDLQSTCVEPVILSLREQVDLTLEQVVPVDLEIDGRSVQFEIDTAIPTSIEDQSTKFCTNYGAEFGVTQDNMAECVQSVIAGLQGKMAAVASPGGSDVSKEVPRQEKSQDVPRLQLDLDIQGRTVRFEVEANYESIGEQAITFCTTLGPEFGVTQESLSECQQNIQRALEERVIAHLQAEQTPAVPATQEQAPVDDRTFQMDLDIQGNTVQFNVQATYESIGEQAVTFCTTRGTEFGVTQESLGECQQNIQRALEERLVAYLSSN